MKKLKAAEGTAVTNVPKFTRREPESGLKFIQENPQIIGKKSMGNNSVTSEDSLWSPEKMAGLRQYAKDSYGSGQQTEQQTAKASKGKFIIGKGKDYIKDLL